MTWSTSNNSTNAFSATSMTDRYLTNQALKNEQSSLDQLNRNSIARSSDSSSSSKGSNVIHSQRYIDLKKKLDCNRQKFKASINPSSTSNTQKGFESSTNSKSSEKSTLKGRVSYCSLL